MCITIPKCLDFLGFPSSEAQPSNHRLPGGHGIFGATGAGLCRCGTVVTGAALGSCAYMEMSLGKSRGKETEIESPGGFSMDDSN